ncbi:MAG: DUF423 domain-containing protein [Bacteroidetes bacterium]|nr:DUF423 domain-containing protein [Bacteroidota bacterium]
MYKPFLIAAAILAALAVALGAFGAHALKEKVSESSLAVYETGIKYMFYHVFALLAVGILFQYFPSNNMLWSGRLFIAGIILFSGSLFALTFVLSAGASNLKWIGAITPFGGLCFIAGWIMMLVGILKK